MTRITEKICAFIVLGGFSMPAAAYLDPGTGSFILQMLIAGIIGAMFTIKLYWYRFRTFVARLFGRNIDNPMEDRPEED